MVTEHDKDERTNILSEADRITTGDRQRYYGHPADNHGNTGRFWQEYIHRKYGVNVQLDGRDVCMMMVLLKISRDANKQNRDNLVDAAGYLRNAQQIQEREEAPSSPPEPAPDQPVDTQPDCHTGTP